jgi:hypothetical protein
MKTKIINIELQRSAPMCMKKIALGFIGLMCISMDLGASSVSAVRGAHKAKTNKPLVMRKKTPSTGRKVVSGSKKTSLPIKNGRGKAVVKASGSLKKAVHPGPQKISVRNSRSSNSLKKDVASTQPRDLALPMHSETERVSLSHLSQNTSESVLRQLEGKMIRSQRSNQSHD